MKSFPVSLQDLEIHSNVYISQKVAFPSKNQSDRWILWRLFYGLALNYFLDGLNQNQSLSYWSLIPWSMLSAALYRPLGDTATDLTAGLWAFPSSTSQLCKVTLGIGGDKKNVKRTVRCLWRWCAWGLPAGTDYGTGAAGVVKLPGRLSR